MSLSHSARATLTLATSLVIVLLAGCGSGSASRTEATRQTRQADTQAPLWSTTWSPPFANSYLHPVSAEVDDAGNTLVLGTFLGCRDCPQDAYVAVFDANGSYVTDFEAFGSGSYAFPGHLRVNDTGVVTDGTTLIQQGAPQVDRFDASYHRMFTYQDKAATGVEGVDLCSDGTAVSVMKESTGAVLRDLDTSGNVMWSASLPGVAVDKIRCLGSGAIILAGTSGGTAFAAQYESDGSNDWTWSGSDPVAGLHFDIDGSGAPYIGSATSGQQVVYALDTSGNMQWSWYSGGSSDQFGGIAVTDVVDLTGGPINSLDTSGNQLWAASGSGSIAIDDADDAFLCNGSSATLLGPDGSTQWSTSMSAMTVVRSDVTNAVARCIGGQGSGISIVAFQVQ